MLNFLKRNQQPQLPDWHSDSVYVLIFRQVERWWNFCKGSKNSKYWQYVLVEEWSSAERAHCRGNLLRLWVRDMNGLSEISLREHAQRKKKIQGRIFPFVIVSFHVYPDKTHVVICHREADLAGAGLLYVVTGAGDRIKLEGDPSGGGWRS